MNTTQNEIVLYQPNESVKLDVRIEHETVWLTQAQIAELFGVKVPAISKHLKNIYGSKELEPDSTFSILENMGNENKQVYQTRYYNLDAILSVGYRVNSRNASLFRKWATHVLKDYLLKGYAIAQRIERLEYKILDHDQKFDLLIKTALPPKEGIFFDGQIFDAYVFVSDLIKSATKSIVLIDKSTNFHDRFLIIDDQVYHIGASLKDLGKRLFGFSKMGIATSTLLQNI